MWCGFVGSNHLYALDLGTTKFCLASLKLHGGQTKPTLDLVTIPAAGMRRGMVSDMREAARGLSQLLDAAEKQLELDIRKVVVGIAGSHLRGFHTKISQEMNEQIIADSHILALQDQAEQTKRAPDREILHAVPVKFDLDHRQSVANPIGFSASKMEAEFFLVEADRLYLKDVIRLCNQAGLEVSRLYSEPFASASVTVDDEKKNLGVVIADIGGGTTDGVVFQNGAPSGAFSLNVGGTLLTSDLCVAFNLSVAEAERVKIFFGLDKSSDRNLIVSNIKGESKTLHSKDVYPVLGARIFELCEMLGQELKKFKGSLGGGIILTGGGSEILGIDSFMQQIFKIPTVKSCPTLAFGQLNTLSVNSDRKIEHALMYPSKFATAMGLLNLELVRTRESQADPKTTGWTSRYMNQLVHWLKEMT